MLISNTNDLLLQLAGEGKTALQRWQSRSHKVGGRRIILHPKLDPSSSSGSKPYMYAENGLCTV